MGRLVRMLGATVSTVAVAAVVASPASAQPGRPAGSRAPELQTVSATLGVLSGVVSDERGLPLTGAMITVAGATVAMTVSDAHGRFSLDRLPNGEYVLRARLDGFVASPRQIVYVGRQPIQHRLQLRRLDAAVGTSGTDVPLRTRPIIAAGFDLPRAETPASEDATAAGKDHPHSEITWRLRHIPRSILKDTSNSAVLVETDSEPAADSVFARAFGSAGSFAGDIFAHLPITGEVNLLTTSAIGPDFWSSTDMRRGVAYFSIGAPTPAGDWLVRGSMSEGDLASWLVSGSFVSNRHPVHTYEVGLTYSTQEYLGGNPAALAAVRDGSRNVGEIRALDRWTLSEGLTVEYGGRYARHDYLEEPGLLSPRIGLVLSPAAGTRISATLAQRMVAPGAEEFLWGATSDGPWLPPERTFAPLRPFDPMRPERARYLDVLVEHEFEGTYVLGLRRFFQDVDDQLVTMFGLPLPDGPQSVGHYYVANAGSLTADGWGVRVSSPPGRRVRASLDYSLTRARWTERRDGEEIGRWVPAAVRPEAEDIHDVTTSLQTNITETSTRVQVLYKFNTAFTRTDPSDTLTGMDGRFELQVNQGLPIELAGTRWEVLVGVRSLFRDPNDPASVYDELLVVRPPTRVIGGVLVRF